MRGLECRQWTTPAADTLLHQHHTARVAADPARVPAAATPGGDTRTTYYRWHGSPRMYYSAYSPDTLAALARHVNQHQGQVWVIFDNTATRAGVQNALDLQELL